MDFHRRNVVLNVNICF